MSSIKTSPQAPLITPAGRPFTAAQQHQLLVLLAAHALDRDTGRGPYEPAMKGCNPVVIGKLRDFGLADSRTVRQAGGSQFTAYWLTPAGADAAKALQRP